MTDFIITWVDSSDEQWINKYNKHSPEKNINKLHRFRDWGTLLYVFRSIEKFSPWVNKVHLITNGQVPGWLNLNNPKLNFLTHAEVFKNKDDLPVFNSNAIELNFMNIKNLQNQFVLFNDDTIITKKVSEDDFFINGLPRDFLIQKPIKHILSKIILRNDLWTLTVFNALRLNNAIRSSRKINSNNLSKYFNYQYGILNNISNAISLFFKDYLLLEHYHNPQPYKKETWSQMLETYKDFARNTSLSKFRQKDNLMHYLFRYKHLIDGDFIPKYRKDFITINVKSVRLANKTKKLIKKYTFVCINDSKKLSTKDWNKSKEIVIKSLETVLYEKSSFEK